MLPEFVELKEEYTDLNSKLMDPSSIGNQGEFKRISSRASQLTPVIEKIDKLKETEDQIEEAKQIIETEDDKEMKEMASEELGELEKLNTSLFEEINVMLVETDPNDVRDAIMEVRAGTGGEEAALFAGDLYRMYMRYAETKGWKFQTLSTNRTGNGGYKEVIIMVSGTEIYGTLKFENGVHRVQRIPTTESSGRIHTSAVSVVVLPEVDDIDIEVRDEDIKYDVYRSSGPGGQSVNTTDSAVRITHIPTGIVVTCQDEKSQHKNKARAMSILKSKLYEAEQEKQSAEMSNARNSAIKGGDRSAKIRTYNYPQSRVTDHRIKKSWHNLTGILDGDLDEVIKTTRELLHTI